MEKTLTYVPNHPDFKGEIRIKIKPYAERLREIAALGLDKPDGKEVDAGIKMIELAQDRVDDIDVTHASGEHFTSFADLQYYEAGCELIQEVAQACVKGVGLGNSKKSRSNSK